MEPIYFDNAATSWPKPASVREAVNRYFGEAGGNPGRSGHRMSIAAARVVEEARDALAELFAVPDPGRIVFTKNTTEALNLAIMGILRPGDHAITSGVEHNSVMRPLRHLESTGVELTVVACAPDGSLSPEDVAAAFRPNTRLLTTVHASNVLGTVLPVAELAEIARQHDVPYLVDAAQTAGSLPIDMPALGADLVALPGHKGLLGLTGTGALYVDERVEPLPLMRGGTGSRSDEETQPEFMPDKYESGTVNVAGLAGLAAGVRHVIERGVKAIAEHELALVARFVEGAAEIPGLTVYGPDDLDRRCGVVSFNIDDLPPSEVSLMLDDEYDIMSRPGLHCAPGAHVTAGTTPMGTVRFGFGPSNTDAQVDASLVALEAIASWAAIRTKTRKAPT